MFAGSKVGRAPRFPAVYHQMLANDNNGAVGRAPRFPAVYHLRLPSMTRSCVGRAPRFPAVYHLLSFSAGSFYVGHAPRFPAVYHAGLTEYCGVFVGHAPRFPAVYHGRNAAAFGTRPAFPLRNPVGVLFSRRFCPQGSRCAATLGCPTESLRDDLSATLARGYGAAYNSGDRRQDGHRWLSHFRGRRGTGPCFRPTSFLPSGVTWPKNGSAPARPVNAYAPCRSHRTGDRIMSVAQLTSRGLEPSQIESFHREGYLVLQNLFEPTTTFSRPSTTSIGRSTPRRPSWFSAEQALARLRGSSTSSTAWPRSAARPIRWP